MQRKLWSVLGQSDHLPRQTCNPIATAIGDPLFKGKATICLNEGTTSLHKEKVTPITNLRGDARMRVVNALLLPRAKGAHY